MWTEAVQAQQFSTGQSVGGLENGLLLFLQGVNERLYDLLKTRPSSSSMLFGWRSISLASLIIQFLYKDHNGQDFIF
jgi:hypothetical protein